MKWLLLTGAALVLLVLLVAVIGACLPRSHEATRAADFARSPAIVFAAIHDFANQPAWRKGLKRVLLLPPRNGQLCYQEESRHGAITFVVIEDVPDEKLVVKIADENLPFGGIWMFALTPTPSGARLRITERGDVKNPLFRFLARFAFGYTATIDAYLTDLRRKFGEPVVISP